MKYILTVEKPQQEGNNVHRGMSFNRGQNTCMFVYRLGIVYQREKEWYS